MSAVQQTAATDREGNMTLVSHLSEVRRRIVICAVVCIAGTLISMTKAKTLADLIIAGAPNFEFIYTAPAELFVVYMKLALTGGLILAVPTIILQLWLFLKPGLTDREKYAVGGILTFGMLLFVVGLVFAFQVVIPFSVQFFYRLNNGQGIMPMMSIDNYIGYITQIMISFGLIFELPIVVILLTRIGLIKPDMLRKNRKYCILIIFVAAAVITPPDVTSQILIALPMLTLFEISILLSDLVVKKNKERNLKEENA